MVMQTAHVVPPPQPVVVAGVAAVAVADAAVDAVVAVAAAVVAAAVAVEGNTFGSRIVA